MKRRELKDATDAAPATPNLQREQDELVLLAPEIRQLARLGAITTVAEALDRVNQIEKLFPGITKEAELARARARAAHARTFARGRKRG